MMAVEHYRTHDHLASLAERDALQAKVDAVRLELSRLESESTYYVDRRGMVDVGIVTHRIRAALGDT